MGWIIRLEVWLRNRQWFGERCALQSLHLSVFLTCFTFIFCCTDFVNLSFSLMAGHQVLPNISPNQGVLNYFSSQIEILRLLSYNQGLFSSPVWFISSTFPLANAISAPIYIAEKNYLQNHAFLLKLPFTLLEFFFFFFKCLCLLIQVYLWIVRLRHFLLLCMWTHSSKERHVTRSMNRSPMFREQAFTRQKPVKFLPENLTIAVGFTVWVFHSAYG